MKNVMKFEYEKYEVYVNLLIFSALCDWKEMFNQIEANVMVMTQQKKNPRKTIKTLPNGHSTDSKKKKIYGSNNVCQTHVTNNYQRRWLL